MIVSSAMAGAVHIRASVLDEMLRHARSDPRVECCGLLAGRDGVITAIFPATNALASATKFEIAPRELFDLFRCIRTEGLEHLGIYHSHPTGDNSPSPSDIVQSLYPDAVYFIISPQPTAPHPVRAFFIREGAAIEQTIVEKA